MVAVVRAARHGRGRADRRPRGARRARAGRRAARAAAQLRVRPARSRAQEHKIDAGHVVRPRRPRRACTSRGRRRRAARSSSARQSAPRRAAAAGARSRRQPLTTRAQRAALHAARRSPCATASPATARCATCSPRAAPRSPGSARRCADLRRSSSREQRALARALDESTLVVQGPPGTGKTWLGARLIVDLIARGKRVGVTAMSHKAINNLLGGGRAGGRRATAWRSAARARCERPGGRVPDGGQIENVADTTASASTRALRRSSPARRGCSRPSESTTQLDYLVIDEAGQLSLADALAAGHVGAQPDPARRSAPAAARLAGDHTRRARA